MLDSIQPNKSCSQSHFGWRIQQENDLTISFNSRVQKWKVEKQQVANCKNNKTLNLTTLMYSFF